MKHKAGSLVAKNNADPLTPEESHASEDNALYSLSQHFRVLREKDKQKHKHLIVADMVLRVIVIMP